MTDTINAYGALFTKDVNITAEIRQAANRAAEYGRIRLALATPVQSGKLSRGWKVVLESRGVRITNDVPYSTFVEMGTRYFRGRRMLANNLPAIQGKFEDELRKVIGSKLAGDVVGTLPKSPVTYRTKASGSQMANYRYNALTQPSKQKVPNSKGFGRTFGDLK